MEVSISLYALEVLLEPLYGASNAVLEGSIARVRAQNPLEFLDVRNDARFGVP